VLVVGGFAVDAFDLQEVIYCSHFESPWLSVDRDATL
jgi:hypothetical protein